MSRYVLTFPDQISDTMRHHIERMLPEMVVRLAEGKAVVLEGGAMLYDLDSPFPGHALMAMLEKNERDRELSPTFSWGDGRMMNRAEWEAMLAREAQMGMPPRDVDFYGEPIR